MTVPAVFDVNVTLHNPSTVPGSTHVLLEMMGLPVRVTVTIVPSGAGAVDSPSCWRTSTSNVWLWPTSLTSSGVMEIEAPQMLNPAGPEKSFSSAVNDCEERVLPMNVEMHGVAPSSSVTSTPNSVNAFAGELGDHVTAAVEVGPRTAVDRRAVVERADRVRPVAALPGGLADLHVLGAVPGVDRHLADASADDEVHRHDQVTDRANPGELTRCQSFPGSLHGTGSSRATGSWKNSMSMWLSPSGAIRSNPE